MKLYEFVIASIVPWLFVVLLVLYYQVFVVPHDRDVNHTLDEHSKDRISLERRKRASDVFMELSEKGYIGDKEVTLSSSINISTVVTQPPSDLRKYNKTPLSTYSYIFFDWTLDSDDLDYMNYKSLESYLACCYTDDTYIEILIVASKVANAYKLHHIIRFVIYDVI